MAYPLNNVPANSTLYVYFDTFENGASVTISGLAVTDIEIYKDGSITQRSSDAGYVLLDTDGIDFDGITGIHGFSIDLSDNTDAGFYAVGSQYVVVVSAITVAGATTVNFIAERFRITPAEVSTGYQPVDVAQWLGTAAATPNAAGTPVVDTVRWRGSFANLLAAGRVDVDVGAVSGDTTAADNLELDYDGTGYAKANSTIGTCTTNTDMRGTDSAALASVCTEARLAELAAANLPADIDAILVDTGTTLQAEVDGIQVDTEDIQTRLPAALVGGRMDSSVGAVAAGAITAAAIATGAIDADALAADAGTELADALLTRQMTQSYAANGVAPTPAQALFAIHQMLMQFGISGTSITVRQLDDSTTAFVVTLDDATSPTDASRV